MTIIQNDSRDLRLQAHLTTRFFALIAITIIWPTFYNNNMALLHSIDKKKLYTTVVYNI